MNETQFNKLIKFFNDKHLEQKPQERWDKNTLENLKRITKENSIWNLENQHLENALIIVGASPCLKDDVKELAKLEQSEYRKLFIIIVVNSALKPCLNAGVKPDYVIAMDGNPETLVSDLDCDNENIKLIVSNNVAPEIFNVWKGKEIWWSPYYSISPKVLRKVKPILGERMMTGGNTFSAALGLGFRVFGSRIFVMVGSEHCYDSQYYAHKKSRWEKGSNLSHWKVKDIKGRERWTNIPLWQYKVWIEHLTDHLPSCHFIDTSYGVLGTDTENILHMDLSEAIEKTIDAFKTAAEIETDPVLKEKARYDAAYLTGRYLPQAGIGFLRRTMRKISFGKAKKFLDVGCGIGQVVAELRNKGYESYGCDISEKIKPYWEQGNITQFCTVCPANELPFQDNEFDIVTCTEVLEHIPEEKVLDSLKEIHRVGRGDFILTYATGKAVHKMPNDGSEPHITIKPMDWWVNKFKEAGFIVIDLYLNKSQSSCSVYATKGIKNDKGKMPTRTVYLQSKEGVRFGGRFINMERGFRYSQKRNDGIIGMRPV